MTDFLEGVGYFDFCEKDKLVRQLMRYMFARTQSIFVYRNLPETIPARNLELLLQMNGFAGIAKADDGKLYAFYGGLGGEPNPYYEPTLFTVANPALNFNKTLKIDGDCVIVRNDSLYTGLRPMFQRYASLQAENAISLRLADINTRIKELISAEDDRTKQSAELFLKRIEEGRLGVIAETALLDSLRINPTSEKHGIITDLIEYEQYIKASWFNEIGLNANYNMKRESLNSAESQMNDDALLPLIDDMLYSRKAGIKKINDMFGTEIEVELNTVWRKEFEQQLTDAPDLDDETSDDIEAEEQEWKEEQDDLNMQGEENVSRAEESGNVSRETLSGETSEEGKEDEKPEEN